MKKETNILRLIVNGVCFLFAFLIMIFVVASGNLSTMVQAMPMYLGLLAFFIGVPSVIAWGNKLVRKQDEIVSTQLLHNCPVSFDKGKVVKGYILMFAPMYLFMMASILIPHGIFLAIYIPMAVVTATLIKMKRPMFVDNFCMSGKKYRRAHILGYIGAIVIGFALRFAVIIPFVEKNM